MTYPKTQKWEIRYISLKTGEEKRCYPRSEEKKKEDLDYCKEHGIKVVSCKKLYPFSTNRNQHNFELICNVCSNTMHDMLNAEIPYDEKEFDRLEDLKHRADVFCGLPLPVAWLPWEEYKEAKELSQMAILHRQNACIENGRLDLVQYC